MAGARREGAGAGLGLSTRPKRRPGAGRGLGALAAMAGRADAARRMRVGERGERAVAATWTRSMDPVRMTGGTRDGERERRPVDRVRGVDEACGAHRLGFVWRGRESGGRGPLSVTPVFGKSKEKEKAQFDWLDLCLKAQFFD